MKVLKCSECGSDDIEYHEFGGWRQQKISVDIDGDIKYGEFTAGEVDESCFHCNDCGHEESNAEEIVAEEELPVKLVCPECEKELQYVTKSSEPLARCKMQLFKVTTPEGYSFEEAEEPTLCEEDEEYTVYICPECRYVTQDYREFIVSVMGMK